MLRIFEGCQLYLPVDCGSMGLSGMEGQRHRIQKECGERKRQTQPSESQDFGEMSSVSIVVLSELW